MASLFLLVGQASRAGAAASPVTGIVQDALERPLAGTAVRLESSDGQVAPVIERDVLDGPAPLALDDEPALRIDLLGPQRVVRSLDDPATSPGWWRSIRRRKQACHGAPPIGLSPKTGLLH